MAKLMFLVLFTALAVAVGVVFFELSAGKFVGLKEPEGHVQESSEEAYDHDHDHDHAGAHHDHDHDHSDEEDNVINPSPIQERIGENLFRLSIINYQFHLKKKQQQQQSLSRVICVIGFVFLKNQLVRTVRMSWIIGQAPVSWGNY